MLVFGLLLVFGTQAVLSFDFNSVSFSPIQQCGPFAVNFSGPVPGQIAMPMTLTVIPFQSTPIFIPIPNSTFNGTSHFGAVITFLPLFMGSMFVASVEDANGHSTGMVSDIIKVQGSQDSSCLPGHTGPTPPHFFLDDSFSQCQPINVSFNSNVVAGAPTVRGFSPRGHTFRLNMTADRDSKNSAQYILNAMHGSQVALLFDDGAGHQETSKLLTVGGDASSNVKCFFTPKPANSTATPKPHPKGIGSLSGPAKVTIGVASGGVVGAVAIVMALAIRRKRLREIERSDMWPRSAHPGSGTKSSYISSTEVFLSSIAPSMFESGLSSFQRPPPPPLPEKARRDSETDTDASASSPYPCSRAHSSISSFVSDGGSARSRSPRSPRPPSPRSASPRDPEPEPEPLSPRLPQVYLCTGLGRSPSGTSEAPMEAGSLPGSLDAHHSMGLAPHSFVSSRLDVPASHGSIGEYSDGDHVRPYADRLSQLLEGIRIVH